MSDRASRREWTAAEIDSLRRLAQAGKNDFEIGDELDRDRSVVCRKRAELRIQPGQSRLFTIMMARMSYRRTVRA